jgi:hypothetical protein
VVRDFAARHNWRQHGSRWSNPRHYWWRVPESTG